MTSSSSNPDLENQHRQPVLSVVVTLYNEQENIRPLAENLISSFREKLSATTYEVVLVLNGPEDNTPEIAEELNKQYSEIVLVRLEKNQGFGGGLLAGLRQARGQIIGFTDGDEQVLADDVAKIFSIALTDASDVVKATRVTRHDGLKRLLVTKSYNALFTVMFNTRSKDINGKPKVFKRKILELLDLKSTDYFLDGEFMIKAKRAGLSIREVPVDFQQRTRGSSNIRASTMIEFFKNMLEYRRGKN